MTKNTFSFDGKNETSQHDSQKENEQIVKSTNAAESNSPKEEVAMPSWCANPDNCMTDCYEYCEKLHADSSKQEVALPSWCANPESCLTDCREYCEKLHSRSSK